MTTKNVALDHTTPKSGRSLFSMMNVMAWIALGMGVLLCLLNVNEFNDHNLGLMVGIGFLIASVQIYVIGTAVYLVQNKFMKQQD